MSFSKYESVLPTHFSSSQDRSRKIQATAGTQHLEPASPPDVSTPAPEPSSAPPPAAPKPLKGFADVVEYHREHGQGGQEVEIIPTSRFIPKQKGLPKKTTQYNDYAVVLRRTWVQKQNTAICVRIELAIQSEALCKAFRKIAVSCYETTDLQSTPIKLSTPFSELFFYRKDIKTLATSPTTDPNLRRDAQALYDFIQKNGLLSSIIRDDEKYSKEGRVVGDILWTLYPPNSLVMLNIKAIKECWICRNVSYYVDQRGIPHWTVLGLRIAFGGESPGLVRQTFTMPMSQMQVSKISDLPLLPFPLEDFPEKKSITASLKARSGILQRVLGKDLSSFLSQTYSGPSWDDGFDAYNTLLNPLRAAKQSDERVIVDFKAYLESNRTSNDLEKLNDPDARTQAKAKGRGMIATPEGARKSTRRNRHRRSDSDSDEETDPAKHLANLQAGQDLMASTQLDEAESAQDAQDDEPTDLSSLRQIVTEKFKITGDDFDLLYPALVPAFSLKEKKWQWLLTDRLQDVKWNTLAFNSLQLDTVTKDLIEALIKGHKDKTTTVFDDVIPGKGQGLIFLLHGHPGLGKTLTAESVADYLERPLYSISGGELSTEVDRLESRLNEIFALTKRWNAVSLLDEADVLLCKRNSSEMDRNAIVAVFLRKIEYFQGVLILTTNRKEDFDEAFKSRIHITISYPDLSHDAQSGIWKALIAANEQVKLDGTWTTEAFTALGKLNVNGRTIKNMLRTAVAYALAESGVLGLRHVLAIARTEMKENENQDDSVKEGLKTLERLVASDSSG
ncbi:unnamed protein product [Clonostachys solani]|uniref:AAA+ ATPase domain-containing protein n=1 Tax=Clonostachys solani TaxID=160281 RepID=A0A9N9YT89_9HYPO|nr:unnamed protein product [Clonostachys solani]